MKSNEILNLRLLKLLIPTIIGLSVNLTSSSSNLQWDNLVAKDDTLRIEYETKLAPAVPWDEGNPVINGPEIYGASSGKDFLYLIPTVGERPINFSVKNLPNGLYLDKEKGLIKGRAKSSGEYTVTLIAENKFGKVAKDVKFIFGENKLALTPPMGWNSWNCFRSDINDAKIRAIAAGIVSSGLAARGYTYVNMDSGWQSDKRGGKFNSIVPHEGFRDMKSLCSYIHSLGLKIGIYSGPYVMPSGTSGCGTTSGICDTNFEFYKDRVGKYIGIDKHEHEDVSQWADWGIDYFKYDWSKTDMILAERMSTELKNASRDIVFSITTSVDIKDATKVKELTNLWRSNGDTSPEWESVTRNGFNKNEQWNPVIGPGHWFDLDMTAILPRGGKVLTHNELITCISCWMMRPSPILIDCEPVNIDDFTLKLLCNEEVIAINQDPLGKPSAVIYNDDNWNIQIKPLADGNYALAFFNLGNQKAIAPTINLSNIGIPEKFKVRDLWNKKDIGMFNDKNFLVGVESHCAKIFKIFI